MPGQSAMIDPAAAGAERSAVSLTLSLGEARELHDELVDLDDATIGGHLPYRPALTALRGALARTLEPEKVTG